MSNIAEVAAESQAVAQPPAAQPNEPQYHRKFGVRSTAEEVSRSNQ